jgi:hypothetical protein
MCFYLSSRLTSPFITEQLMGAGASSRAAQLSITDPKVCRSFLVGTCPHDLFTNTKQDLGQCPKVHSEPLKTEYESSADKAKYGFEYDYMRDLQKYIDECNRRIDVAQRRLEKTPDEIRQTNALVGASSLAQLTPPRKMGSANPSTFFSSSKSPTSPSPLRQGCWKSRCWASRPRCRGRTTSSSASSRPCRPRATRSASSRRCRTPAARRATRSCRSATSAARTCPASTTTAVWRTTFTARCTWAMPRCAGPTRACRRS